MEQPLRDRYWPLIILLLIQAEIYYRCSFQIGKESTEDLNKTKRQS